VSGEGGAVLTPEVGRFEVRCERCGRTVARRPYAALCPDCGGTLGFVYDEARRRRFGADFDAARTMWDAAPLLPVAAPARAVTLGEGGTPLLAASAAWGCRLWLKDETRNPTGSHKDRALSVAITCGREMGFGGCVVISAGSTGLSTAAYAARAGMSCAVVVPAGTPDERLVPVALFGGRILEAPGTFETALRLVEGFTRGREVYLTSTYRRGNPYQAEGAKTIGYEIARQMGELGESPDWIVVPTGGGGTAAGIWRAYEEMRALAGAGWPARAPAAGTRQPRIATVQPAAYNALEIAMRDGLQDERALYALGISEETPTVQAKLQHGVPPDAVYALEALRASGGVAVSVTDAAALTAQRRLAAEGLFGEPSAAAALAGVRLMVETGVIKPADRVVALVTGSGFREMAAARHSLGGIGRAPLTERSLVAAVGGG
jgi:threonine synthase